MKRQLKTILSNIQITNSQGNLDVSVDEIVFDSRQAKEGKVKELTDELLSQYFKK